MPDREKVIASLGNALVQMHGCGRYTPEDVGELETAAWGALKLLEEQEPHLMTLDEIQNAKDIPAYWFEDEEGYMASSLSTIYDWYGHNISFVTEDKEGYLEGYTYPDTQYGKTWRCWSARPTDEQRKAVKWDDDINMS